MSYKDIYEEIMEYLIFSREESYALEIRWVIAVRERFPAFGIFFAAYDDEVMEKLRLKVDVEQRGYSASEAAQLADDDFFAYFRWIEPQSGYADFHVVVREDRSMFFGDPQL